MQKDLVRVISQADQVPSGWISMELLAEKISKAVDYPIYKQTIGRVARLLEIECKNFDRITELMIGTRYRCRKSLLICLPISESKHIERYIRSRLQNGEPLFDPVDCSKTPDPTPDEIRERCAAIRQQWSERERESRHVGDRVREIEVTQYHVEHVQKKWVRFS